MIETQHLVKHYGDKVAVHDVSFEVHGGEIFGFLGPNG
ncbi:MAG: ABC transporter ATP-binding protein, partial [Anaerolineae bacterium]